MAVEVGLNLFDLVPDALPHGFIYLYIDMKRKLTGSRENAYSPASSTPRHLLLQHNNLFMETVSVPGGSLTHAPVACVVLQVR
jgi:hypothetical protein